jgi:hypothetical protein
MKLKILVACLLGTLYKWCMNATNSDNPGITRWRKPKQKMKATLNNYKTGEVIREATAAEIEASRTAGTEGVIEIEINGEMVSCYVEE